MTTVTDSMRLYEFTPPSTGQYRIEIVRSSGDHEGRLYDSAFKKLDGDTYFYKGSYALTGGSLYYVTLTHFISNTDTADSVILINKT